MKFYIVDAFTEIAFGGNPAGVVILDSAADFPADALMVKTAAELRYSETAFIRQLTDNEFQIRYFTPAAEVNLCGHATIASFAALLDAGLAEDDQDYICRTLAGNLNIKLQGGFIMMEMAQPEFIDKIEDKEALDTLYSVMNIACEPVAVPYNCSQYLNLLPMIISTGLPDILLPVKNRDVLNQISPDFSALRELSKKYQVVGVHAFTLDHSDYSITAHCRNFAPLYEIDEEAATGTANGALTYYLYAHGLIGDDQESIFLQGEAMNRPSKILSHVRKEAGRVDIQIGGNAVILAKGEIFI